MSSTFEYPIAFSATSDHRLMEIAGSVTPTDFAFFGEKSALLALSRVLPGHRPRLRFNRPYTQTVFQKAISETRPAGATWADPARTWCKKTIARLHYLASQPEQAELMASEIGTYYEGIIQRAVQLDDDHLYLPVGTNAQGERPLDYVGINKASAVESDYEKRTMNRRGYYRLQSEDKNASTIASRLVWHIPGLEGQEVRNVIGEILTQRGAADSVPPAQLFNQAQFVYLQGGR